MIRRFALTAAAVLVVGVVGVGLATLLEPGGDAPPVRPSPTPGVVVETLDEQVARVAEVVEDIRGLSFDEVPEPTAITPDELGDRVGEELQAYTTDDAAEDQRILEALGAIEPDEDLRALVIRGYSEQVGGFYDPATGELVVGAEDPSRRLGRLEEIILAHELQHALADSALGLPDLDKVEDGDEDRALARQALIEGDATITMQRYMEVGFSVVDQLLLPGELAGLTEQLAGFTELPHYLQRSLTFPYEEGAVFVGRLLSEGDWQAVDRAYEQPPTTTAEILFPERYPAPSPPAAPVPTTPGPDWQLDRGSAFGAADLLFLFEAPGDDPSAALEDPLAAVATWRSGIVQLYSRDDATAVAISLLADDTGILCPAMEAWYDAAHRDDQREPGGDGPTRWGGGRWHAELVCGDDSVALGIAPSAAAAAAMVEPPSASGESGTDGS